jgi:rhodanese-related sulfurtransferase
MKRFATLLALAALAVTTLGASAADGNFPHRARYKNVPLIEPEALYRQLDTSIVIDVRSAYEYETLHIKDAIHLPLTSAKFIDGVKKLRAGNNRPMVFYCNGETCKKSYQAVEQAQQAAIPNVMAYDAGLETWAKRYPDKSTLLGQTPMRTGEFIDHGKFKNRVITAEDFEARVGTTALVLDIRDLRQRDAALFPFRESRAQLDEKDKLSDILSEAKRGKKTLLVYDKAGRQVRWFQYLLEKEGVKNYYFLDGGQDGYYDAKYGKLKIPLPDQS